jgi:hypothetical protein
MESNLILQFLEEMYPDKLPFDRVDEYTLGVLIGQRQLIEQLKIKLKISKPIEEEIR